VTGVVTLDSTAAIFADRTTSELIARIEGVNVRERERVASAEEEAVDGMVRDRRVSVGIALP
jgi:hypothetical protein